MTTLPEIFTGVAPSKDEIAGQCLQIVKSINEGGNVNPLRVATTIKALETAIKLIRDGIESTIIDEAEKHEKTFDFDGHSITLKEIGVRYDFSICNDPEYEELSATITHTKEAMEKRESFLKSLSENMTIVDDRTGEVVEIEHPNKTSKTNIAITLK